MQMYKTLYFPDVAESRSGRKGLTIAFSEDDIELYQKIENLSSVRLRSLLEQETFSGLMTEAKDVGLTVNALCKQRIRKNFDKDLLASQGKYADGLQATFSGGRDDPLHNWFPYLEGYSPDFVWETINRYAPEANTILDPFSGAGTTPITVMSMGKTGLYSDVNPVCLFLIKAKALARKLSANRRKKIASELVRLADNVKKLLRESKQDSDLRKAYIATFGQSQFFSDPQFAKILKLRSLLDGIENQDVSIFATIAAMRSLIPASLLIRRGDLRFKTPKEQESGSVDFADEFVRSLFLIASDIKGISQTDGAVVQVGTDALKNNYTVGFDAIITSPPYLNGTNYFRNTKVELWFIRQLLSKEHLGSYRQRAVTAGINDVTKQKAMTRKGVFNSAHLQQIVSDIEKNAYDSRIPLMVHTYFCDLWVVLEKATEALNEDGVVALDIGDSAYGGIHVPTDSILSEMLDKLGLIHQEDVTLRERMSRNGQKLRQALLVFKKKQQRRKTEKKIKLPDGWKEFKDNLPHQSGAMAARNWGNPLHSLCSYQGKLKPAIANSLVTAFVPTGGKLLDPFAGVGTIPFEGALNGIKSFGFEISPSAYFIANAKVHRPQKERVEILLKQLDRFIKTCAVSKSDIRTADEIAFNGRISLYFHEETLKEIISARKFFAQTDLSPEFSLLHACMQHILHGNRPYALSRNSHPLTPYAPSGDFEYKNVMDHLRAKVTKSLNTNLGESFCDGRIWLQDCTEQWPDEINNLDAIITSPPFFDSTRFYLMNWMRLWFSGWEKEDFKLNPARFIDERQKLGFNVYDPILRQARDRVKKSGVVVFHLGQSRKCDMAQELSVIAKKYFRVADLFSESVSHCESHGIRDKGTVTAHQYLVVIP